MEKRFSEAAVVEIIVKLYFYDKQKHKYAFVVLIIKSNLNVSFFKYELQANPLFNLGLGMLLKLSLSPFLAT